MVKRTPKTNPEGLTRGVTVPSMAEHYVSSDLPSGRRLRGRVDAVDVLFEACRVGPIK